MKKKTTYTPLPLVPEEIVDLYRVVMEVQAGDLSVSDAARRLSLSRNRFQTRMHRGLEGLIRGLQDRPTGRPSVPPREQDLENENRRLRRQNEHLVERLETIERLLGVAGGLVKGQIKPARTTRTRKKSRPENADDADDDPARGQLGKADTMRTLGIPERLTALVLGLSQATIRRWRARAGAAQPIRQRPGPGPRGPASLAIVAAVAHVVRETRGLAGASSLRHCVPGVSRRQAATIKRATLTAIERERVGRARRVTCVVPGVVRGFDAMHQCTTEGAHYALVFADAAIPYRTIIDVTAAYDADAVAAALRHDIASHGAPYVYRADRCRAHQAPAVRRVLEEHGVLLLHGPPRHPGYYGQLERQNREHRAWLGRDHALARDALPDEYARMRHVLNDIWRRPTLGWQTASEAWNQRPRIDLDRGALREEVEHRAARIRRHLDGRGKPADLATRLAIEQALIERGLLKLTRREC
jgi:hypothetical protein